MPKSSGKPKSEYAIATVSNALRVLEVFHTESEIGVSDLARRLGLHKNNAFRLLATLELGGYVQQAPESELYRLAPRCLELGHAYARNHELMDQARPILEELAATAGETAHLGQLHGAEVVHLDAILPDQLVLTGSRIGERLPSHCTALGKALLAGKLHTPGVAARSTSARPSSSVSDDASAHASAHASFPASSRADAVESALAPVSPLAWLCEGSLEAHTDATIVDPSKLVDELRHVHMQGYGVDLEEYAPGLRCVAAPVRDASAQVVAALTLSGPSFRLTEEVLHGDAARAVTVAASELSQRLGAPV